MHKAPTSNGRGLVIYVRAPQGTAT